MLGPHDAAAQEVLEILHAAHGIQDLGHLQKAHLDDLPHPVIITESVQALVVPKEAFPQQPMLPLLVQVLGASNSSDLLGAQSGGPSRQSRTQVTNSEVTA